MFFLVVLSFSGCAVVVTQGKYRRDAVDPERQMEKWFLDGRHPYHLYQLTATLIYIYIDIHIRLMCIFVFIYVYVFIYDIQRDSFLTWHIGCLRRSLGVCCNFKEINIWVVRTTSLQMHFVPDHVFFSAATGVFHFWFYFRQVRDFHSHFVVSCGLLPPSGAPRSEGPERATSLTTATVILWFFDQQKAQGKG